MEALIHNIFIEKAASPTCWRAALGQHLYFSVYLGVFLYFYIYFFKKKKDILKGSFMSLVWSLGKSHGLTKSIINVLWVQIQEQIETQMKG